MRGDEVVSIKLEKEYEDKYFNNFLERTKELFKSIGHLRYYTTTGLFCSLSLNFVGKDIEKWKLFLIKKILKNYSKTQTV